MKLRQTSYLSQNRVNRQKQFGYSGYKTNKSFLYRKQVTDDNYRKSLNFFNTTGATSKVQLATQEEADNYL